jgi:hypothetical protein
MKKKIKTRIGARKRLAPHTDTGNKLEVAQHGRVLTPLERAIKFRSIFSEAEIFRRLNLDLNDAGTFRAVASAIDFLKKSSTDIRADILALKGVLDENGKAMTIKDVAANLQLPAFVKDERDRKGKDINKAANADRFRWLRILCRELNFPIKIAQRGRPRKSPIK